MHLLPTVGVALSVLVVFFSGSCQAQVPRRGLLSLELTFGTSTQFPDRLDDWDGWLHYGVVRLTCLPSSY